MTVANSRIVLPDEQFEHLAPKVVVQLREALAAMIEAIPASDPIRRATDLERALDLPTTLAWKIFTVARADEPLVQVANIPGASAMKRFFDAAAKRGVAGRLVTAARVAFAEFDEMVRVHAGSRNALDSMVSGLKETGSDQKMDLQQKRAAYKACGHIWGVQAQTQLSCFVFHPSPPDPTRLDMIGLRGLIGLRRLRKDVSWIISHARVSDDDGKVRHRVDRTPIDALDQDSRGVSLLKDFCSQPLPRFRTVPAEAGFINTELEPTNVGGRSAVTCLIGDVFRAAFTRFRDEHNSTQRTQSMIRTPSEVLIHDVLAEPGTFGAAWPRIFTYGDHRDVDPALPGRDCDLLALRESVICLGRGPAALRTPDVPRYPEMARYAIERAGWDPEKFEVYRCRVEYPVMPSSVVVQFDLLDSTG